MDTSKLYWESVFNNSCKYLFSKILTDDVLTCSFSGEETDFIRFNNGKVRQATNVSQGTLALEMIRAKKRISLELMLSNDEELNLTRLDNALHELNKGLEGLAEDPFITASLNNGESFVNNLCELPTSEIFLESLKEAAAGKDLAGVWCSGHNFVGNQNSLGQSHWFASSSFYFDYSIYSGKERAVKGSYSGKDFSALDLSKAISESCSALEIILKDKIKLKPGKYRCYLAPSAIYEILGLSTWVGAGALQKGQTFTKEYESGVKTFSPLFSLREDFSLGLTPPFNDKGEVFKDSLDIVKDGKLSNLLTSSDSAKEYSLKSNFSNESETLRSAIVEKGSLKEDEIIKELGTGLYISNLHYLNWSDVQKGRITGMTRFGCYWVEDGAIVGPINDMRFDETLTHMFGAGLDQVTDFSQIHSETGTYFKRSIGGLETPGMIINDFTLSL
jgi:predicted Zn-dependent protease